MSPHYSPAELADALGLFAPTDEQAAVIAAPIRRFTLPLRATPAIPLACALRGNRKRRRRLSYSNVRRAALPASSAALLAPQISKVMDQMDVRRIY